MILYIVTADTYKEGYGAEIDLLLVTEDRDRAEKEVAWANKRGWYSTMQEVETERPCQIHLGGYIE